MLSQRCGRRDSPTPLSYGGTSVARIAISSLIAALAFGAVQPGAADAAPAVARPSVQLAERTESGGTVFFLAAKSPLGVAAVGTAHTFAVDDLLAATRVTFHLGKTMQRVAVSTRFLTAPGRPFNEQGSTLADDFIVYALDAKPSGVRVLEPETQRKPKLGDLVQILGIPTDSPNNEDDIYGRIIEATPTGIEVVLDVPHNLRGWGGAPVLLSDTGRVIGMLQASWPQEARPRVSVGPLQGVLQGVNQPLDGGAGRPFARFSSPGATAGATGGSLARTPAAKRTAEPEQKATPAAPTGKASGDAEGDRASGPLFSSYEDDATQVHLEIDYPPDGSIVSDSACGVFVAGRALALEGELRHFEVAVVIDTSRSTIDPSGADINGNGNIGRPRLGGLGSIFGSGSTDAGDSILAAEIVAARQLLRGLDPRSTRVTLISFAGDPDGGGGYGRRGQPAFTLEPLTTHYSRIEQGLDMILAREPAGATHMAAGVDRATIELLGLRGALSKPERNAEKVMLFFTDGQPTLPYGPGYEADNVRAVLRAANRAQRAKVRIHSFAIGPDALDGPIATVEMAARTDGFFTPVRHPGDLVDVIEQVSFANVSEILVRNTTTDEIAHPFRRTADGAWAGLVPARQGPNRVEVAASSTEGATARRGLNFRMVEDATSPQLPPELIVQRNRLLEDCLLQLKQVRVDAERDAAEQVRKELLIEIDEERAKARQRADEQRKRLQLDVEDE